MKLPDYRPGKDPYPEPSLKENPVVDVCIFLVVCVLFVILIVVSKG